MTGMSCSFEGKIVTDPTLKTTRQGTSCLSCTVAYPEYNGESKITQVGIFGGSAKTLAETLKKGQDVSVTGSVSMNTWQKGGETKYGLSVNATSITPLDAVSKEKQK